MRRVILMMILVVVSGSAMAGIVIQADDVSLQPQTERDNIGFRDCGVRGVVLVSTSDFFDAYDFSLMIRADMMYGTLKAGKARTSVKAALNKKYSSEAIIPPPINFWIAKENEGKAIRPIKIMAAETKGYILELADFVDTYDGIMSIIHGERMQFSIRYKDEPLDKVISFSAEMPEIERAPLERCMNEAVERISKIAKEKTSEVLQ